MSAHASSSKRKTPLRDVQAWVDILLEELLNGESPSAAKAKLLANELSYRLPPMAFSEETKDAVARDCTPGAMPSALVVRDTLERWLSAHKPAEERKQSGFLIADRYRSDPRFAHLTMMDQAWLARWEKRHAEILAGSDPLWESSDPDQKARSRRATLANLVRQQAPKAWEIASWPMGELEIPEAIFMKQRYGAQISVPPERRDDEDTNF